jgi:hypothetical protein
MFCSGARRVGGRRLKKASPKAAAAIVLVALLGSSPTVAASASWTATGGAWPDRVHHSGRERARRPYRKLRFAVLGDFGTGGSAQAAVARRMCRWRRHHPFRHVISTGDNIYPDGSSDHFQVRFFRPYSCLLGAGVRFHASLGNHDVRTRNGAEELAEPAFGFKGGKRNYVWRKRDVRFVVLDSNALNVAWLKAKLPLRRRARWTIVVFHHPVYSPGPHGPTPGFLPLLPKLFRRWGVDLVLNGHDHLYSVSRRLKGIRYVVSGGGGGEIYPCEGGKVAAICRSTNHFLYVRAGRRSLRVRAIPVRGRAFHRFRTRGRD